MSGFWTIQQVLAFVITFTAVAGIAWRVIHRIYHQSSITHAKIDAIESLLAQVQERGMTKGAESAFLRLEKRLLLTQAQVRLVMEIDGTGYIETNKDGGLVYCNTQFIHWTGMTVETAKGYGWASAIHKDDRARVVSEWESAVRDQRSVELWYRYKYGTVITSVHARTVIVHDDTCDEVLGYIALITPTEDDIMKGS